MASILLLREKTCFVATKMILVAASVILLSTTRSVIFCFIRTVLTTAWCAHSFNQQQSLWIKTNLKLYVQLLLLK